MIQKMLVPLNDAKTAAKVLAAAIIVARKFNAHIHALYVRPDSRDAALAYLEGPVLPSVVEDLIKATDARTAKTAAKVRTAFHDICTKERVVVTEVPIGGDGATAWFDDITDYEDRAVASQGRVSDLLIFDRAGGRGDLPHQIRAEAALVQTGRPMLLLPPKSPSRIGSNVAIAWNDSLQSARAVGLAMDFIVAADTVTIITAKEEGADCRPQSLLELLDWHNVRGKIVQVSARGDAGKALLATATKTNSDLIVMGAYGHSRAREWVFGGVTRHVLDATTIPALMVH